jgi:hypothetical protein
MGRASVLTTEKLVQLNGRITGKTGGSRLATLRALKRVELTKEGIVLNKKVVKA